MLRFPFFLSYLWNEAQPNLTQMLHQPNKETSSIVVYIFFCMLHRLTKERHKRTDAITDMMTRYYQFLHQAHLVPRRKCQKVKWRITHNDNFNNSNNSNSNTVKLSLGQTRATIKYSPMHRYMTIPHLALTEIKPINNSYIN